MKHLKKFLAIATIFTLFLAPLLGSPMTANAAEGTTYYVKYIPALNQFRYQKGPWQADQEHWDFGILGSVIKDGDSLAIDDAGGTGIIVDFDVKLNSLTIVSGTGTVVTAKSVKDLYILHGTTSAINADVTNANIYGEAAVNLNKNVKILNLYNSGTIKPTSDVNVVGTCGELHIENSSNAYSFQENTLHLVDGILVADTNRFSFTPPTTPSTSNDEYDDVPKTGDTGFNPLWLFGLAAICFAGSFGIKKIK